MCRLLARKGRGRRIMTTDEITSISGLGRSNVDKISKLLSWRSVKVEVVMRFSMACGVNLFALKQHKDFWRRRKLDYLNHLTSAQKRMVRRLDELLGSRKSGPGQ